MSTGRPSQSPSAAPEPIGLKLQLPLLFGYTLALGTHLAGLRAARAALAATPSPLTPAAWGLSIWELQYAGQGLGVAYAFLPHGYGGNGLKERLVRIAGACWPFSWTFDVVWQWCFGQGRFIACALVLQCAFAGNLVALFKLWPTAHRANRVQRLAYSTPSAVAAAWATFQSALAAALVTQKKADASPAWLAPLLQSGIFLLALLLLALPPHAFPAAPPLTPYPLTLIFAFLAVADAQARKGLAGQAGVSVTLAALLGCAAAAAQAAAAERRRRGDPEAAPLLGPSPSELLEKGYDALERVLAGLEGGAEAAVVQLDSGARVLALAPATATAPAPPTQPQPPPPPPPPLTMPPRVPRAPRREAKAAAAAGGGERSREAALAAEAAAARAAAAVAAEELELRRAEAARAAAELARLEAEAARQGR